MSDGIHTCTFDGCERKRVSLGLCQWHYKLKRRGEPLRSIREYLPQQITDVAAVFWAHVQRGPDDHCWPWRHSLNAQGYGMFKDRLAHRLAYELAIGPIAPAMQIDHQCRNRACVNPGHLKQVTNKVNHENLGIRADNSSGVRGVSWCRQTNSWAVKVSHNGVERWGGRHATLEAAERAAIALRNKYFTNNVLDQRRSA